MIDVVLSARCVRKLKRELRAAGTNEIGGVLAAEQTGNGQFLVVDLSVQRDGTRSQFDRDPVKHRDFIQRFHERMGHKPERFNYLGEWHSHPTHPATPSAADFGQMQVLVEDKEQLSSFLVLMIVKLNVGGDLCGSVYGFRSEVPAVRGRLRGNDNEAVHEAWEPVVLILGKAGGLNDVG